jgi:hypothetical protein
MGRVNSTLLSWGTIGGAGDDQDLTIDEWGVGY